MSDAVALPGVRAQTPMGLLVALGILDLLAEYVDTGARLSWRDDGAGHCAAIHADGAVRSDDIASMVFDAIAADPLDRLRSLAADLNKVSPEALHDMLSLPGRPRVLSGLCAEAPLRPGGQVAMTPMAMISFQGRRSVFAALLKADAELTEQHVRALLHGPWRYVRNVATLNLDPAAREQDSARMSADASADGTRGTAGALAVAARGLSIVPPMPARSGPGKRPRVAAVQDRALVWPVWMAPLTRFGVRALMGRAWGAMDRDDAALAACGVIAVYRSEIVDAKDGRRLALAHRYA